MPTASDRRPAAAAGAGLPCTVARDGVLVAVRVQPKASANRLAGLHDGALKLALTAPPVDNRANKAAAEFLARLLGVPKSAVTLRSGGQSRSKTFLVATAEPAAVLARLVAAIETCGG